MKKSVIVWIVVIVLVIIGIIIWMSYNGSSYSTSTSTTSNSNTGQTVTPAPSQTTTTQVLPLTLDTATSTAVGTYIVDSNGMTLYTYSKDTMGVSNCSGVCLQNWPPYTVASFSANSGTSITGVVSAITRADGSVQVTYKGLPLYHWYKDLKAGDVTGNGVGGFKVAKP